MKKLLSIFITVVLISCTKCTNFTDEKAPAFITVMSFNVENLFDAIHQGTEYSKYDPDTGAWTEKDYLGKLLQVSKVIKASGEKCPDIISFLEIENQGVLEELAKGYLSNEKYKYIAATSNRGSSINSGIISKYPLKYIKYHTPYLEPYGLQRQILETSIKIHENELIIFTNHWKAKLGTETEAQRIAAADLISTRINNILATNPKAEILLLGDFNENYDEYIRQGSSQPTAIIPWYAETDSKFLCLKITGDNENKKQNIFFSPWMMENQIETGSYFYGKTGWETIDNFFLNSNLTDQTGFHFKSFRTIRTSWNTDNQGHPQAYIKKTGTGCSDHFPIVLELLLD